MNVEYEFQVFERAGGVVFDDFPYATGSAPTLEECKALAREYTAGDFAMFQTRIFLRTELEAY